MKAVKLHFKTPLRAGKAGLGLESTDIMIRSDTLFSSIISAASALNLDMDELLHKFSNGELRISSCFPFNGNVFYLPAPHIPFSERIPSFLEKSEFEELISGNKVNFGGEREIGSQIFETPKVTLDRITSNSGIYYMSAVKFKENAGLYFLFEGSVKSIKPILKFLQDEGIGGKKVWGLGKFTFEFEGFDIKEGGERFVTLSLTYPQDKTSVIYWKPITRSGWIQTEKGVIRKPKIIMASEGSVFSESDEGKVIDVDKEFGTHLSEKVGHRVYIYGKSFMVKAVIGDEN